MSSVTKPILKDETFSSKMDSLIACFSGHTLTIHASASDSIPFSGQEVKIKNMATGAIAATVYVSSAADTVVNLPDGFNYGVFPVVTLAQHYCEDKPTGLLTANATVNLTYQALGNISTFTGLKAAIDAGLGKFVPIGTEVSYIDTELGTMTYECADFDDETDTMTLLMKNTLSANREFDSPEALYYCSAALPAGAYKFKNNNTDYYFTLTQEAALGSQIKASTSGFTVYTTKGGATIGETGSVSTTVLGNATDLGTTGAGVLNHMDRVSNGSNDYGESALRQYLNASGYDWWVPKTMFDRPPSYVGVKGFMTGIPADVLACIDTSEVLCASQNTYCAPDSTHSKNSRYTLNDKFFLASQMEIFGSTDFVDNSKLFNLYIGATNADRIKRYGSSARYWWLRSPNSSAIHERHVNSDGSLNLSDAGNSLGVAAACKISKSSI